MKSKPLDCGGGNITKVIVFLDNCKEKRKKLIFSTFFFWKIV
jgi:hypothetical protein